MNPVSKPAAAPDPVEERIAQIELDAAVHWLIGQLRSTRRELAAARAVLEGMDPERLQLAGDHLHEFAKHMTTDETFVAATLWANECFELAARLREWRKPMSVTAEELREVEVCAQYHPSVVVRKALRALLAEREELSQLAKDGERFRYLIEHHESIGFGGDWEPDCWIEAKDLRKRVDAALAAKEKE